eukprot:CAMPEP_0184703440 /NCGR_PEP_ID=MMETSP0313-20130426/27801_1 /TAXON_ID=2792 /ORGANISM="Porphyridium aerugineum, Strain SAG 1380-2" /LENGTH=63 /DNA_ID=CAMNT_0027164205 /DNA_START=31 /DNA_END=219 /DNA_ORIENTATION=+
MICSRSRRLTSAKNCCCSGPLPVIMMTNLGMFDGKIEVDGALCELVPERSLAGRESASFSSKR